MTSTFGQILEQVWEALPDEWASHPGFWIRMLQEMPLELMFKTKLQQLINRWSRNYSQWSIGSFPALKKKIGKTADITCQMFMPANQSQELLDWLKNWQKELEISEEDLSELLSMAITSTPSTAVHIQTNAAGAASKISRKRKKTLDDFFESLHPSKRSSEAIGKISQSIFVRKGDEQRSLKSTVSYKDFLLKLQIYPTLSYQAKLKEDHTQAWRTATTRLTVTLNENEELHRKVMEVLEVAKDEVLATQEDQEESEGSLE
ncbi:non-structural protein [Ambidensovirus_Croatia_17_S17]|uniref:Non-structural protein n=1 Tax=Ambidensovirus_Croatia_17_S17 TaxID=3070156 RepID=A0A6C0PVE4_9VIRU|nr:non-structural protein [Ambidensovirus_Croatia_17_S17]QHY93493.1 non-structural protein [Ambidensovirus_Croatia_17_S17]